MPVEVDSGSLEGRIIRLLLERYPITTAQVARYLHLPPRRVERELLRLAKKGYVALESLPDRTYVRLLRTDFKFVGLRESQKQAVKRRKEKREKKRGGGGGSGHMGADDLPGYG